MPTQSSGIPVFIGTYTRSTSQGIYSLRLHPSTGELSPPEVAAKTPDPTYLSLSGDRSILRAVCATPTMSVSFKLGPGSTLEALQGPQTPEGPPPCHITHDLTDRVVILSNYHTGIVAAARVEQSGGSSAPKVVIHTGCGTHPVRQQTAHVHCAVVSPDNRFVLVCDLGLDRIFSYALDTKEPSLTPARVPFTATVPGSGPRHLVFSPKGNHVYVSCELSNTVSAYAYDAATGGLSLLQTLTTLPPGFTGESTAAAIRIHPNGKFLYVSNRGSDTLALFFVDSVTGKLAPGIAVPAGGNAPRDFALTADGQWLLCAHHLSDSLTSFKVDPSTGKLTPTGYKQSIPMPVCVVFA